jgi:hypothetical protein
LLLLAAGCGGPTAVDRDNRRVVDEILTAMTLKNRNLLDAAAKRLAKRHGEGQVTDEQNATLEASIQKARSGNWDVALADGYEFRKEHPFVHEGQ